MMHKGLSAWATVAISAMALMAPAEAEHGLRLLSNTNPTSTNVLDTDERRKHVGLLAETNPTNTNELERKLDSNSKDGKKKGGKSDSNSKDGKKKGGKSDSDSKDGGKKGGKSDSDSKDGGKKGGKSDSDSKDGGKSGSNSGVAKRGGGSKDSGSKDSDSKDSGSKSASKSGSKRKFKHKQTKKDKNKKRSKKGSKKSLKSKKQKRSKKRKQKKTKKQADDTRIPGQCVADHQCAEIRGDPHITTFDGLKYDCQGAGEFVLLKSLDSALEIQARFHEGRVAGEGQKAISVTQGISIDEGVEGSPQLDVFTEEVNGECQMNIYVNGELATDFGPLGDKYPGLEFMPDVDVGADFLDYVFFTGSALMFTTSVKMGSFGCVLNSKFCIPPEIANKERIVGLLGSPYGPDWMTPTGAAVDSSNSAWEPAYDYCTSQWCVADAAESIFGYETGTDHSMFNKCGAKYNPTAETLVENPSADCVACCAPAEGTDSYDACLLECVEGGTVDCEIDLFAVVAMSGAERACPEPVPEEPQCHVNSDCLDSKVCERGYCLNPAPEEPVVEETEEFVIPDEPEEETTGRNGPEDDVSPDDKTTAKAFTKGDPHFKTFGGELYDFHGECDLILLDNPQFKEGMGMQIQIRTKITDWWSSVDAAAIKIGEETLEIQANIGKTEWMWLNGQANDVLEDAKWYQTSISGFLVRFKQTMTRAGEIREAMIYFDGGHKDPLVLKTFKSFVHLDVNWKGSENYNGATGLLGSQAHNGARLGRSGELIEDVNAFGQDWQVSASDAQLFHSYENVVVAPNQCRMPENTLAKQQLRNRRLAEGMPYEEAEKACSHLAADEKDACIYDVLATQDADMAGAW